MGRYRSRSPSRSYSPRRRSRSRSPPRRKRYDDPRDRYRGGRSYNDRRAEAPSGLLVRNIALNARSEDLRVPFEHFGPVKDVYLPRNYYSGEPRGFGFVKFRNADDAAEAKRQMNHKVIGGREISIVYAEENRKTPLEMRSSARVSGRYVGRRRSPPRSPRRRYRSYSRSPSPIRDSRDRGRGGRDDYYSPERSVSRSPYGRDNRRYRSRSQDDRYDRSPVGSASPKNRRDGGRSSVNVGVNGQRSRSRSPASRSRSRSLGPGDRNGLEVEK